MKMARLTERCLEALGASPDFTDDVLGDLAEEFALRATYDGVNVARRWYYREALRVAPYLLRDALRNVRGRELLALAATVLVSMFVVALSGVVLVPLMRTLKTLLAGFGLRGLYAQPVTLLSVTVFVLLNGIRPMLGGYVAAAIHKRAPLLGAAALAVIWLIFDLVGIARFGTSMLQWIGIPSILIAFLSAGALLRVCRAPRVSIE